MKNNFRSLKMIKKYLMTTLLTLLFSNLAIAGEQFPTCNGLPQFPTIDPIQINETIHFEYTRECNDAGQCSPWTLENKRVFSSGPELGLDGILRGDLYRYSWQASKYGDNTGTLYTHRSRALIREQKFDSFGNGTGSWEIEAEYFISGTSVFSAWRMPVTAKLGRTCFLLETFDPKVDSSFGQQKKSFFLGTW
jgi:hypothetical protein